MVFYFSATGNSLYVARNLDADTYSIPQEMKKNERRYKADRIGIVCPLFEVEVPDYVKDFIRSSVFDTDYFYMVITYGMHHGGVAERTAAFLKNLGKQVDYINTIIMHDNAIIVFDMDEQRKLESEKKVDEHIAALKADISAQKKMIQPTTTGEEKFYQGYVAMKKEKGPMYTFPLYKVTEACVGCGTCTRICPRGCIHLEDKRPVYNYSKCINCMACAQSCPKIAIKLACVEEPNPNARYRNPNITLADLITSNHQ